LGSAPSINAQRNRGIDNSHVYLSVIQLVLFRACETHKTNDANSQAISKAKEYFEKRGTSPRIHRNMIAFLAADKEQQEQIILP
jgi:hypothetical protein